MTQLLNNIWWLIPTFVAIALVTGHITCDTYIGRILYVIIVAGSFVSILEWIK
jgi:hypothetical protein